MRLYKKEEYDTSNLRRKQIKNKIVVFGFNRMARSIKDLIKEKEIKFIVIDRSPERLKKAESIGATVVYGDLKDDDILKGLKLEEAEVIVSTVPDIAANLNLLNHLEDLNIEVPTILNAFHDEDALELYEHGADFVLHPYVEVSRVIHRILTNKDVAGSVKRASVRDIEYLNYHVKDEEGF
ncbi:MAG: NAD-binding protein [Candidatus Dojkabacteria bacterium]|nr:NAD-binding protein [Candidatus Dojkabacteria bacterium]